MKDEKAGRITTKFAGFKAKAYAYVLVDGNNKEKEVKKVNGVKKCVADKLKYGDYKNCTINRKSSYGEQRIIRNRSHSVCTEICKRTALDMFPTLGWKS